MSKLIITYLNGQKTKRDVTGVEIHTSKTFLEYELGERKIYIPLINIESIEIRGSNQIRRD